MLRIYRKITRPPRAPQTARAGAMGMSCRFTLIELLVVVSIIALLMALLLPALQRATESARTMKCCSNLGQIAVCASSYADDNYGFMVIHYWQINPGADWPKTGIWVAPLSKYTGNAITDYNKQGQGTVFECPNWGKYKYGNYAANVARSYAWNSYIALFNDGTKKYFNQGNAYPYAKCEFPRVRSITSPSKTALVGEGGSFTASTESSIYPFQLATGQFSTRHGGYFEQNDFATTAIAFADGHVAAKPYILWKDMSNQKKKQLVFESYTVNSKTGGITQK